MKKIFIYFSLTGNGDYVANYYKEKGYEIRKVITKSKYPKKMFPLMMIGGFKAATKHKDKLVDFDNNIDDYDEIVIGSPIWFDRLSCPTNTVLSKLDLTNKSVTFVLYSGSGTSKEATKLIEEKYKDAKIINLKEPKNNIKEVDKL